MNDHGRQQVLKSLQGELIGPDPHGEPLDTSVPITFQTFTESRGPWIDKETGEEILTDRVSPMRRYGVGVLFPDFEKPNENYVGDELIFDGDEENPLADIDNSYKSASIMEADPNDYDLATANEHDPRSAAISFVLPKNASTISVTISGAYYEPFTVTVKGDEAPQSDDSRDVESDEFEQDEAERDVVTNNELAPAQEIDTNAKKNRQMTWYVRRPIVLRATINVDDVRREAAGFRKFNTTANLAKHPLSIDVYCYLRKHKDKDDDFVTVAVKNNGVGQRCDTHGLFQTAFYVECFDVDDSCLAFPPYPEREDSVLLQNDPEARSISLLYRDYLTYAVGHGCSADWTPHEGHATKLIGHFFPTYETPSITPDITDENGKSLAISMKEMAGLESGVEPFTSLRILIDAYERWIESLKSLASDLPTRHIEAATRHIADCTTALNKMRRGLALLESDEDVRRAFQYANESVYKQQMETPNDVRKVHLAKDKHTRIIEEPKSRDKSTLGYWRPFQIGFLLSALSSTADPDDADRETVELIFFPTGGGKTEAYQALIAFSLFLQRLRGTDQAVGAVMRYTLRLLTTQQFTRAASLICAMELVRREHGIDGRSFSIGIWVGGSVTPLYRRDAIAELNSLTSSKRFSREDHHFLLTRCPRCSASFERISGANGAGAWPAFMKSRSPFTMDKETVVFTCPNPECEFHAESSPLPVWVVDEDIYEQRPSLVIATVDKFAQVAFRGDISRLFGMDHDGNRIFSPPSLIVQDELHLISGPLGTMVGLYESLFEEFCIDRREGRQPVKPKIVCSTATIRNYQAQIKNLYAREQSVLFPPQGLSIEDSFFACYSRDKESGQLDQGRLYVGVLGTSLRSTQDLQVRTNSALLQAPKSLPIEQQDPWYTLLSFFNRIQDIGTTLTLLRFNVRAYLKSVWERQGTPKEERRYPDAILELTSRIKDSDLPKTIDKLFNTVDDYAVDVCLASNIIEVGVDIPRLSLMSILGQPKTTAQYIQVSGRVGRDWRKKPGMIVTMYPPRRARDKSHFEKFRSYHQRLYAAVEPTSVTPFSTPALERALHAVIVGYVRNFAVSTITPQPVPQKLIDEAIQIVRDRLMIVDPAQLGDFERLAKKRVSDWQRWQRTDWSGYHDENALPLIYGAGTYMPASKADLAWETPQSMRNVDAECVIHINDIYVQRESEAAQ